MTHEENGVLIGYARVSTTDQKLDLQMDALRREGVATRRIYTDMASGGMGAKRPGFAAAMRACRKGDTLVVWKLDRLGRSLMEVLQVLQRLEEKGAHVHVITEKIDTGTAMGRFVMHILVALAEMERGLIRERTMAGLAAGRARGRVGGRVRSFGGDREAEAIADFKSGMSPRDLAEKYGVSKSLIYERIRTEWTVNEEITGK